MITALCLSIIAALVLTAVVWASRPHELLAGTVGRVWEWWQIHQPVWLPAKASGLCTFCTVFWWMGWPLAAVAYFIGAGWWALAVPFMVAVLAAKLIEK